MGCVQGCLAVRNMVARNPEFVEAFLDAGAEQVLREAGKSQVCVIHHTTEIAM